MVSAGSLNPLAEEILMCGMKEERFHEVATLKEGATWEEVVTAFKEGRECAAGASCEGAVGIIAKSLAQVVESTTLTDDGF